MAYWRGAGMVKAIDGVSFEIARARRWDWSAKAAAAKQLSDAPLPAGQNRLGQRSVDGETWRNGRVRNYAPGGENGR